MTLREINKEEDEFLLNLSDVAMVKRYNSEMPNTFFINILFKSGHMETILYDDEKQRDRTYQDIRGFRSYA